MVDFFYLVLPWLIGAAVLPLAVIRGWDLVLSIIE